jgi:hypothetical protein
LLQVAVVVEALSERQFFLLVAVVQVDSELQHPLQSQVAQPLQSQ